MKKLVLLALCITLSSICFAPKNPFRIINLHIAHQQYVQNEEIEKRVSLILKTIRVVEAGGSYTIGGASGERGAYQFMPATWRHYCLLFFNEILDINNPFNQDKVARAKVRSFVDKGYSKSEIASVWNCGSRYWEGKVGVNWKGIPYDVPRHVNRFNRIYNKLSNEKKNINMRSMKAELEAHNENINSLEEQWTYKSIENVVKRTDKNILNLSGEMVSACEAGVVLRKAILSIPPQDTGSRLQRVTNWIRNLRG